MIYLMSIIEMMISFIYYNTLFNKHKKGLLLKCIIAIILGSIFYSIPNNNNSGVRILIFILQGIVISKLDKKETFLSIIEIGIANIIICVIELLMGVIAPIILGNKSLSINYFICIICGFFIIIAILLSKLSNRININIEKFLNRHRLILILIINILVFVLFLIISIDEVIQFNTLYFEYIVLMAILILANSYCYKNLYKDLQKKRELEINTQYKYVIDELLDKFRANEHEYNNHLNTLNAMIEMSDNSTLKGNINNYIINMKESETYSKLMYIKNAILRAVLFNKIKECEEKSIIFNYDVICNLDELPIEDTELSILLNNLLNNSIEAVNELDDRIIKLKIFQGSNYEIVVENNVKSGIVIDQNEIFKKGISTKGKERGYGLYNVKKIVKKYKGTIQLSFCKQLLNIRIVI